MDEGDDLKLYVIAISKCYNCGGSGWVTHPEWVKLFDEEAKLGHEIEDVTSWFKERGYLTPPNIDLLCDTCDGTGNVETRIPLEVALNLVKKNQRCSK